MKKILIATAIFAATTLAWAQQKSSDATQGIKPTKEQKQKEHLAKMKTDLNLTDAQVRQIEALHAKLKEEHKQQKLAGSQGASQVKPQKGEKKKEIQAEMQKILSKEQYEKWESQKKDHAKKESYKGDKKKGI